MRHTEVKRKHHIIIIIIIGKREVNGKKWQVTGKKYAGMHSKNIILDWSNKAHSPPVWIPKGNEQKIGNIKKGTVS